MKKLALAGVVCALLGLSFCAKKDEVVVRVCKVIEHEALNSVVSGMQDYLRSVAGKKYKISVETCQGNAALASQILAKFASNTDIVVTIGTIPSQVAYNFAKNGRMKVVFSSVTNPADISSDFKNANMTGVSNFVSLEPQLELFKKIQATIKKIGMIYNTGKANSVFIVREMEKVCEKMGITLVSQGISKISELMQATEKVAQNADAVFISNDNMVLSSMENVCYICKKYGIPVYVSDTDQVQKGCAAALGPNQYEIGVQTGKIVERVSKGENINDIAPQYPEKTECYVNTQASVKIPTEILSQAKKIF